MSKLSVGIVGLPNVGKSTLFNALLKKQQAYAANFPFATIEPNVGVVPVPDERLLQLAEVIENEIATSQAPRNDKKVPIVPATIEFVDIAGLIAGAHKGEGLGNKFLAHIREVDAILHVVRVFTDENIIRHESRVSDSESGAGNNDPKGDFEIITTELAMADFETLSKQKPPKGAASKEEKHRWSGVEKILAFVEKGLPASDAVLTEEERKETKQLSLLTDKPILVALNVEENDLVNASSIEDTLATDMSLKPDQVVAISAKVEEELSLLTSDEAREYLEGLAVTQTGLERLIQKAFKTLGLSTFLTAGEKEVRAWTIPNNISAPKASGVIHTDFEKKFIKADVVSLSDFIECVGWKNAREKGKVRIEGSEYKVKDGDVIEFKIGA